MKNAVVYFALFLLFSTSVMAQTPEPTPTKRPDVPYVPTRQAVVDAMLEVAGVKKSDVVYDLGSGDGRIVITAAKNFGSRGVGIDINPDLVKQARENAEKEKVSDKVTFIQGDLFDFDFSKATVVTLYLLPEINLKLRPILWKQLKPGTRVVSHSFSMGDWTPEKTIEVDGARVYFWRIPEKKPDDKKTAPGN